MTGTDGARRGDDVEVVDLDAPEPAPASERQRTYRAIPLRFVLTAVVMSTLLVAAAAVLLVLAQRPRHATRTVVPPGVAGVDAGGCPATSACVPVAVQFTSLYLAVARRFGQDPIVYSVSVHNGSETDAYRSTVVVRLSGEVQIVAVAGCVPNGRPVPARTATVPARGPVDVVLVTPGDTDGCSAAVSVSAPAGAVIPVPQIQALAADRRVYG